MIIHTFYVSLLLPVSTKIVGAFTLSSNRIPSFSFSLKSSSQNDVDRKIPKAIIFDLDGLIWTPEMYVNFFQNGRGSPFSVNPKDPLNLLTCGRRPVSLLGDSRFIFRDLFIDERFQNVKVGISSRTDEPEWARELLTKFPIPLTDEGIIGECITLETVVSGPIEIAKDEKVDHFARIAKSCNIDFEDILFFDNEYRNCQSVAQLGVSVVYCPDGITRALWNRGLFEDFPRSDGTVINVDFAL
ncbi:hypothetical protein CTEN210_16927 [Chaetoceros tenuissimus]|uniref:Magnesium-dependent phosphatase 1 n=1 Tax=Chaetoceros tenuissimus TaxID=426638 RepID=A0AAD3HEK4_9STRA|nr:hypothetical protein CTEN210_16927 [Chaetoceros tenuissimus]